MITPAIVAAALLIVSPAVSAPPPAAPPMQDRIVEVLQEEPGGVQTGWNEVSWNNGEVTLTLESALSSRAVAGCAAGKYCAYSKANYLGNKLTFSTCNGTKMPVSGLGGAVRSVANSHTKTVRGYNSNTQTLTVKPNAGTNTTAALTSLSCS